MLAFSVKDHCEYDAVQEGVEPCRIAEVAEDSTIQQLNTPKSEIKPDEHQDAKVIEKVAIPASSSSVHY